MRDTRLIPIAVILFLALNASDSAIAQGLEGVDFRDSAEFQTTKHELLASALVDLVNSVSRPATERFLIQHTTESYREQRDLHTRVLDFQRMRWRMGAISLQGERMWASRADNRFYPIVQDEGSGSWWQFDIAFVADGESRISSISFNPITAPAFAPNTKITAAEFSDSVSSMMRAVCERESFSGVVLVARMRETLATESCGEASKTFAVPVSLETRFHLGSMNKMFTAIAAMQQVEQGNLELGNTLDTYLDESWVNRDVAATVRIEHLMSHRAGFGSYLFSLDYRHPRNVFPTLDDHRSFVREEEPSFESGAQFRYSNTGMILVGAVIEAVTGEDYYDVIRERIYDVANMDRSDSYALDEIVANVAEPYMFAPDEKAGFIKSAFASSASRGTPAGGGYSTAADLQRFGVALLDGQYVSDRALEEMWTDRTGFNTGFYGYGLGFEVRHGLNGLAVGHNGSAPGVSTNFEVFPESGYIVVVLSNYSNAAVPIARRLSDLVARLED